MHLLSHQLATVLRLLNCLDAILTCTLVLRMGAVAEWNPLMRPLLSRSLVLFILVKLAAVSLLGEFLARRGQVVALAALNVLFVGVVALSAVLLLHPAG